MTRFFEGAEYAVKILMRSDISAYTAGAVSTFIVIGVMLGVLLSIVCRLFMEDK